MIDSKDFMNDNYIPVVRGVMPLNTNEDNVVRWRRRKKNRQPAEVPEKPWAS